MKKIKSNVVRVNYSITPEVKGYIQEQAYSMGISASAFITICVDNYKMQRK